MHKLITLTLLSWFFLLYNSHAGSGFATVIGPFSSVKDCRSIAGEIPTSIGHVLRATRCWEHKQIGEES